MLQALPIFLFVSKDRNLLSFTGVVNMLRFFSSAYLPSFKISYFFQTESKPYVL